MVPKSVLAFSRNRFFGFLRPKIDFLRFVFENGVDKSDRTGTGTRSTFGGQLRFDLSTTFPLVTTKKVHLKSIIYELLWFLSGSSNVQYLQDNGVSIWNEFQSKGPRFTDVRRN